MGPTFARRTERRKGRINRSRSTATARLCTVEESVEGRAMRRKVFWSLAVLAFIGGGLLVVAGLSRGDNGTRPTSSLTPFGVRSPTPADPSPPVPSATADPSDDTPTVAAPTAAVATPTPYHGSVGRMIIPSIGVDYPLEQIGVLP